MYRLNIEYITLLCFDCAKRCACLKPDHNGAFDQPQNAINNNNNNPFHVHIDSHSGYILTFIIFTQYVLAIEMIAFIIVI